MRQVLSFILSFFKNLVKSTTTLPESNNSIGIIDNEFTNDSNLDTYNDIENRKNASLNLLNEMSNLLDLQNIKNGELKLSLETFNLKELVVKINQDWKESAIRKGLNYNFEIDNSIPENVQGDAMRFAQVINNIISNAVKFTNSGTVDFTITSNPIDEKHSQILIKVADSGSGIQNEKLLNSIEHLKIEDKPYVKGIGLSLVKKLVDLFEGKIIIESQKNIGTKVFISIDLKTIELGKFTTQNLKNIKSEELKVLIVEDNLMNQMILKKILLTLSLSNFKVANHGKEGLEMLQKFNFDFILMDLQMPIMDGFELTRIIRNDPRLFGIKDIPILAVTADATETARKKAIAVGMNDFITKPLDRQLLHSKILQHSSGFLKIA